MGGYLLSESGSATALIDAARREKWSFDRLAEAAGDVAKSIAGGKRLVFLYGRNNPSSVAAYLGAVDAGHAVTLLDPGVNPELQRSLTDLYQPDLIFHGEDTPPPSDRWIEDGTAGDDLRLSRRRADAERDIHPELSVLLSTSGSTGSPKLVRLTRAALEHNTRAIIEALAITPEDGAISSLPLYYSYGLSVLNSHLLAGAHVVLTDEGLTGGDFWKAFQKYKCTSLAGVPYSYQLLRRLDIDRLNIPTLRTLTQAGGKLADGLVDEFHRKITTRESGRFFVMYGQTEAAPRITTLPSGALPEKLGSAGLPLRDGEIDILVDGRPVTDPDIEGEVVYRGPNVMMGYAQNQRDLALGDEMGGRLETGDLGKLDRERFLFITGRLKRIAKVFGLRVNLDEVEQMLKTYGPAAAIGENDRLRIFCEFGDEKELDRLTEEMSNRLAIHRSALRFERVEQLPLNANGKIDYAELKR